MSLTWPVCPSPAALTPWYMGSTPRKVWSPWEDLRLPTSHEAPSLVYRLVWKTCRRRAVHFQDDIEVGNTNVYPETHGPNSFMKLQPLQIFFKSFPHVHGETAPPLLLECAHPLWHPKVCSWMVTLRLHKLIQRSWDLGRSLPHRHITIDVARVKTNDAARRATPGEATYAQDPYVHWFRALTHAPFQRPWRHHRREESQRIVASAFREIIPISIQGVNPLSFSGK